MITLNGSPCLQYSLTTIYMKITRNIFSVILLATSLVGICYLTSCDDPKRAEAKGKATPESEIVSLTSEVLAKQCSTNEESARITYGEKVIQLTGTVTGIAIHEDGNSFNSCELILFPGTNCKFTMEHKEELAKLKIGVEIHIKGTVNYISNGTAHLTGCFF